MNYNCIRSALEIFIATWLFANVTMVSNLALGGFQSDDDASRIDSQRIDFDLQIRPLLSDRCYKCHGPDDATREANLRLDVVVGLESQEAESTGLPILSPGQPDNSELFLRIVAHGSDRMPPEDSGLSLTETEIEQLRRWIEQGATWDRHWSFNPVPARVEVPQVEDPTAWIQTPLDAIVLQEMQQQGLVPTLRATDHHLLRRMFLDLIGVPPEPLEVEQWLAEPEEERWSRLADHLLERPEFGQRMASDWLDVARYSDTYGYQVDRERFVWPWRDWVVQAFNDNLPFDQFGSLQIAGDMLPNATFQEILPTTFSRLHPQEVEGGSVEEEFRMKYISDRTETYGMAFLGLTLECCRCHNHKYDPISQEEYYRLTAFFDNIDEAGLYSYFTDSVPTPTTMMPNESAAAEIARLTDAIREVEAKLADVRKEILQTRPWTQNHKQTDTEKDEQSGIEQTPSVNTINVLPDQLAYLTYTPESSLPPNSENRLVPVQLTDPSGEMVDRVAVEMSGDEAINLQVGNFRRWQPFSVSLWLQAPTTMDRAVVLHRSRAWTDAGSRGYELLIEDQRLKFSLIHFWPGNAISVRTTKPLSINQWYQVSVTYDGSSRAAGLKIFVNGESAPMEIVRDHLTKQISGGGGDHIAIGERFRDQGFTKGQIAEVRVFGRQLSGLEIRELARPSISSAAVEQLRQQCWNVYNNDRNDAGEPAGQLPSQLPDIEAVADDWALLYSDDYRKLLSDLEQMRQQLGDAQDRRQEIMVMRELESPRPTYLRDRGEYDAPTTELSPGVPDSIFPLSKELPNNRLGLARWTFDRNNPLTARVAVNRWWQMFFGEGLVRTPEDFGNQGRRPTHPLLLDFLAADFMDSGWDVKRLLKQMVLSATYQQSVVADPITLEQDPENLYWARASSHRWPAETLRDQALAVAGLLDSRLGGPPVKPYDLAEAFAPLPADSGDKLYRRSLYTYWKRMSPSPIMITLDAVKRDVCQVKRERTTTPAQSLVFLNAPQFVEASRALAVRCWSDEATPEDAVATMFFRMMARAATDEEMATLLQLYNEREQRFLQSEEQLQAYLKVGHFPVPPELPIAKIGALAVVGNMLMGLDQWTARR